MERVHRFEHLRSRHKIKQLLWLSTIKVIESLPSPTQTGCIGGLPYRPMLTFSSPTAQRIPIWTVTWAASSSSSLWQALDRSPHLRPCPRRRPSKKGDAWRHHLSQCVLFRGTQKESEMIVPFKDMYSPLF